jgi:hypothetical protein
MSESMLLLHFALLSLLAFVELQEAVCIFDFSVPFFALMMRISPRLHNETVPFKFASSTPTLLSKTSPWMYCRYHLLSQAMIQYHCNFWMDFAASVSAGLQTFFVSYSLVSASSSISPRSWWIFSDINQYIPPDHPYDYL